MADWRPTARPGALQLRATMLAAARDFFAERAVLEVETPLLCDHAVTELHIDALSAGADNEWLRTSPEYHMKRLLAAGSGDIYQIGKVFRAGERGRLHQPEFTMIEWYRLGRSVTEVADECCDLIDTLVARADKSTLPRQKLSYRDAFMQTCGLDPLLASAEQIRATALRMLPGNPPNIPHEARSDWLDLLAGGYVYPQLGTDTLLIINDYPADQAMLARLNPDNPAVAERFEIFLNGVELANGYYELADASEQADRFAADNIARVESGRPAVSVDPQLLAALHHGLPDCSGVALGLDRLLLLATDSNDLDEILSFLPGA